jgi:hypothetical protein
VRPGRKIINGEEDGHKEWTQTAIEARGDQLEEHEAEAEAGEQNGAETMGGMDPWQE